MKLMIRICLTVLVVLGIAGCNVLPMPVAPGEPPTPTTPPTATVQPSATAVVPPTNTLPPPTPTATVTATLAKSLTPTLVLTPTKTGTPTKSPTPLPPTAVIPPTPSPLDGTDVIFIEQPGPGSKIISPVTVSGEADPTFEQNLVVQVLDESGKVIASKSTTIQASTGQRGRFSTTLLLPSVSDQAGRVVVYSTSAKDGGLVNLSSSEVSLIKSGKPDIKLAPPDKRILVIATPANGAVLTGNSLQVTGFSSPVFENTISVVLCGGDNPGNNDVMCGAVSNIMGKATAMVNAPDVGQPGPFTSTVTFAVTKQIAARLLVYDTSARDGKPIFVRSVNIAVKP